MNAAALPPLVNSATKTTTIMLGIALAVAGMHHGVLEILQGNRPTNGVFIMAVARGQLMWTEGTEGALTLIPNFLATGIATVLVATAIVTWLLLFLGRRHGPLGFLCLFILLTLVGGGIGHVAFFVPVWAYATRIRKPLAGWRKLLPSPVRPALSRLWTLVLALTTAAFIIALEISIFGIVAGLGEANTVLWICWAFLGASWLLLHLAYACAAAFDIERRDAML